MSRQQRRVGCGPGLLESAYELCLAHELTLRGVRFERHVPLSVPAVPIGALRVASRAELTKS